MTVLYTPEPRTATPTDWVVEDIPAGTFRIHRTALIDEAVFRDEMRALFERCWLYVGHESEIPTPGDFRARDVGNRPLVFWHGHDGVRRVFYNSYRHRGALVCRVPEGTTRSLSCFYHAWTYGSTGALTALPGEEGYGPTFDRAHPDDCAPGGSGPAGSDSGRRARGVPRLVGDTQVVVALGKRGAGDPGRFRGDGFDRHRAKHGAPPSICVKPLRCRGIVPVLPGLRQQYHM
jgi:Rieske [2Fe-2S] domain